ncbi:putative yVTN beta-propeller repeat-containing protein [Mycobacterium xenopi 3993]|nr:putative yVTN beta-propeller repeat-containing protein [Mycobacterium xenopi 3993]
MSADRPLVYVPHNRSGDVWEIDPVTYEVVAKYPVGREIQHVVPAHDMRTLYATDDVGNQMLALDPRTGQPGVNIPILDPYNLYFTPDGRFAISVAERLRSLIWYSPVTWQLLDKTPIPECAGINHADFSVDGHTAVFSCEFAGAWRWSTSARTGCCAPLTCRHAIPTWAHRTSGSPPTVRPTTSPTATPAGCGYLTAVPTRSSGSSPPARVPTGCSFPGTPPGFS